MSKTALIGYTGYVGSTLRTQAHFDDFYNSSNIAQVQGESYDLVVCAAAPAVKWKANQAPEADLGNIQELMGNLKKLKAKRFVLISTVDVYRSPIQVDEATAIDAERTEPYGRHRFYLEKFVHEHFSNFSIIRLPGLFGPGLKKNFIYDLIHDNALHITHYKSQFQFYNMTELWSDIQTTLREGISLVNFASEPVSAKEIAEHSLNIRFENVTEKSAVFYDMRSKHTAAYNSQSQNGYMRSKTEILKEISDYIKLEKEQ